jgi:hypothetical protein
VTSLAPQPAVVLVHGAYADGSSWSEVIERLQRAGLAVAAVQNPLTSLADDVRTPAASWRCTTGR